MGRLWFASPSGSRACADHPNEVVPAPVQHEVLPAEPHVMQVRGASRVGVVIPIHVHTCYGLARFFFPWPKMPHQQFDENMDRVACQRRCEEDDQETVLACPSDVASVC